jgi:hypothetical protein
MFLNGTAWLHGLVSAFITGAVGATGGVVIAPETFNLQEGFHKLWQLALWAGITGAFTYLKTSPLPAIRQAIEDRKAEAGAILLACGLLFSTGCASTTTNADGTVTENPRTVEDFVPAVKTAAMVGTHYVLRDDPDLKPRFVEAAAALKVLANSEQITFTEIMAIVLKLDVKQLKSDDARMAIAAGTILLSEYGGRTFDLSKLENVRPIAKALHEGIELGL